ncbi:carboxylesterase [Escherichia coli]|nr:carboxylesterase [Escherichia coli]MDC9070942.1 hypothetical protein [Escherichia coli]NHR37244.1 carboxylesterase [Escherichia coli]NUC44494.1 carboxylesterase [Escherichia coli]NUD04218.1 carboxylesterase [Escherichia coli]NUD39228.1 carboxylesterase [Escherichia coli]
MLVNSTPQPPIEFETGADPHASIILFHGLGTSGHSFKSLTQNLTLTDVGSVRFVLPNAPTQAVTWANGQYLPAWYDLRYNDFTVSEDETGLRAAMNYYQLLIDREIERGISPERIIIGGFSQGGAISLMTGIRFGKRLGGIFSMSGYLPIASTTLAEQHNVNRETSIFIGHGQYDTIVLPSLAEEAYYLLQEQGHHVTWNIYPIKHTISQAELDDLNSWLVNLLKK